MKNIYFVQAGYLYGNNAHFPYACGCIAAYAWQNPAVRESYSPGRFIFLREKIDEAIESLESPYLVAFSNYVWNFEYHKLFAERLKKRYPECLVVFGGHQILNNSSKQLGEYPFIDFLIHGAGEIPFERLLLALNGEGALSSVPNISYRGEDGGLISTPVEPCQSADFPSPYLSGMFDGILEKYSFDFAMIMETNRGCPYRCAFCDWGTVRSRLLEFPMERVKAEIDWAAKHHIDLIFCADSNFGILARDEEIVDYCIESKKRTGFPIKFDTCFAKNSDLRVFEINNRLHKNGMSKGATLSFQSTSQAALENVGRKNLTFERYSELMALYNSHGVPTHSELILGLAGETYDSFCEGIDKLIDAGQHSSLDVYLCELLPNAEIAEAAYVEKHGIELASIRREQEHCVPDDEEAPEYMNVICKTNTMPRADWVRANVFSNLVQGLHGLGLTQFVAIYLHNELGLRYKDFYNSLIAWARENPSTVLGGRLSDLEGHFAAIVDNGSGEVVQVDSRFGAVNWGLEEILFLCLAVQPEAFFDDLNSFLGQFPIQDDLRAELLKYQRTMAVLPEAPQERHFSYDFHRYFSAALANTPEPLIKADMTVAFPRQGELKSLPDYAREVVWYGRRGGNNMRTDAEVKYGC
ncbi:MAG: radical SAM protein [Clostridium sp.]|jgi:putative methyltransferase|nr:radical SAM protein [Clostridium sp.]